MAINHYTIFLAATAAVFLSGVAIANASLCAHVQYPVICNGIVDEKATPAAAANTAIELLLRKSIEAKALSLTQASHTDSMGKQLLGSCKDTYDDAISSLQSSLSCLKSGDKAGLNSYLSAALSDYVACDDGFLGGDESPLGNGEGHANPLSETNSRLVKIASTALSFTNAIH